MNPEYPRRFHLKSAAALAAACMFLPLASRALTWDAVNDFNVTNNPNDVWSYGYADAGGDNAALMDAGTTNFAGVAPGLWAWTSTSIGAIPVVYKNTTAGPLETVPAGALAMHPGPLLEIPLVLFTVPATGSYYVNVTFNYVGGGDGVVASVSKNLPLGGGTATEVTSQYIDTSSRIFTYTGIQSLTAGENLVFAIGAGGNNGADVTVLDTLTITSGADPAVAVTSSANPANYGAPVTFTATLTGDSGTPTGTVQFKDGGIALGAPVALSGGVATWTGSSLLPGSHVITAEYGGDGTYLPDVGTLAGDQTITLTGFPSWDATTDFTTTDNDLVNGVWSYGHVNTAGTNAVLMDNASTSFLGFPGMWGWNTTSEVLSIVYKNESAGDVPGFPPPGMLALHPSNTPAIGIPFVMFTAPTAGNYLVDVTFNCAGGGSVMASVSGNLPWGAGGAAIAYGSQALSPSGPTWAYSNVLTMNAGDNVVFAVGVNPDQGGGMTLFDTLKVTNVTPSSSAYDTWAGGTFANPPFGNTAPEVDFDNDGLNNLLEFVLGGDPTISQNNVRPTVAASGADLVVTFNRSDESETQPVAVKVQVGNDLVTWNPADDIAIGAGPNGTGPNGVTYTVAENGGAPDTVVVTIPKGAATKKFARVVATQ